MTDTPYARYLFYGYAMEGKAPKRVTDRPLKYTKTKNPNAGPRWDKALSAAEGAALAADLERYIKRRDNVTALESVKEWIATYPGMISFPRLVWTHRPDTRERRHIPVGAGGDQANRRGYPWKR